MARNNRCTMSGCRDVANEVRSARAGAERAHASAVGGRRSRSGRPRRHRHGRARDRNVTHAYRTRHQGTQIRRSVGAKPYAARRRRSQAGRATDPTLVSDLNALLEPITAREPDDSPLRWTSKSVSKLTAELQALGHAAGRRVVNELLHHLGYTLQANRKSTEGTQHPDRDAQFNYLNEQVRGAQEQGQPVISVDTKKKELIGEFKNGGGSGERRANRSR